MASDGYVALAGGRDATGMPWEVGVNAGGLIIKIVGAEAVILGSDGIDAVRPADLIFNGESLSEFTEAVARAVTPGQLRVKHGPGCGCTPCKAEPSYESRRADAHGEASDGGR